MYGQSEFPVSVFNVDPAHREPGETVQRAGVVLPSLAELSSHMSQLVQRHGAAAVVAELLKVVPARHCVLLATQPGACVQTIPTSKRASSPWARPLPS